MKILNGVLFAILFAGANAFAADACNLPNGEITLSPMQRNNFYPSHTFIMPVDHCTKLRMYTIDTAGHIPTDAECGRSRVSDVQMVPGLVTCNTYTVYKNMDDAANGASNRAFKDKDGSWVVRDFYGAMANSPTLTRLTVMADGKIINAHYPTFEPETAQDVVSGMTEVQGRDPGNVACQSRVSEELTRLGMGNFDHPGDAVTKRHYSQSYSQPTAKGAVKSQSIAYNFIAKTNKTAVTYTDWVSTSEEAQNFPAIGPTLTVRTLDIYGQPQEKTVWFTKDCKVAGVTVGAAMFSPAGSQQLSLTASACKEISRVQQDWNKQAYKIQADAVGLPVESLCNVKSLQKTTKLKNGAEWTSWVGNVQSCSQVAEADAVCHTYQNAFAGDTSNLPYVGGAVVGGTPYAGDGIVGSGTAAYLGDGSATPDAAYAGGPYVGVGFVPQPKKPGATGAQ